MKAAAFFQPEDHVKWKKVHASLQPTSHAAALRLSSFQMGAIFGSGVGMFVVHDLVLHQLAHGKDMDTAPAIKSAIAGTAGGMAYALGATPTTNYMCDGYAKWRSSIGNMFKGLHYTLLRDMGGYGLYFGCYTVVRGIGIRMAHDEYRMMDFAESGVMGVVSEDSESDAKKHISESSIQNVAEDLAWAGLAGAIATIATYCWRAPINAMYKIRYGWRAKDSKIFDLNRFVTSPRGLRMVGIGTVTWVAYEATMRFTNHLAQIGQELNSRDLLPENKKDRPK